MIWLKPHISKVYEALTAIADKRIELVEENKAHCYSSSKGKYYEIEYNPETKEIMSNDNTAYFTGAVSYPMIALLMLKQELKYDQELLEILKNIVWKDVMTKFKNDYSKGIEFVLVDLKSKGIDVDFVRNEVGKIYDEVCKLELGYLGKKKFPPKGY